MDTPRVPITCPLIDKLLDLAAEHGCLTEAEPILEELREWHKQLRYNANVWEAMYKASLVQEYEFNPEVLPPCLPSK